MDGILDASVVEVVCQFVHMLLRHPHDLLDFNVFIASIVLLERFDMFALFNALSNACPATLDSAASYTHGYCP